MCATVFILEYPVKYIQVKSITSTIYISVLNECLIIYIHNLWYEIQIYAYMSASAKRAVPRGAGSRGKPYHTHSLTHTFSLSLPLGAHMGEDNARKEVFLFGRLNEALLADDILCCRRNAVLLLILLLLLLFNRMLCSWLRRAVQRERRKAEAAAAAAVVVVWRRYSVRFSQLRKAIQTMIASKRWTDRQQRLLLDEWSGVREWVFRREETPLQNVCKGVTSSQRQTFVVASATGREDRFCCFTWHWECFVKLWHHWKGWRWRLKWRSWGWRRFVSEEFHCAVDAFSVSTSSGSCLEEKKEEEERNVSWRLLLFDLDFKGLLALLLLLLIVVIFVVIVAVVWWRRRKCSSFHSASIRGYITDDNRDFLFFFFFFSELKYPRGNEGRKRSQKVLNDICPVFAVKVIDEKIEYEIDWKLPQKKRKRDYCDSVVQMWVRVVTHWRIKCCIWIEKRKNKWTCDQQRDNWTKCLNTATK